MATNEVTVRQPGGIGLPGALFIAFLVLKLTHVIDWSWWWVTAPLWIPAAFWGAVLLVVLFGIVIGKTIVGSRRKKYVPDTRPRKAPRGRPRF